MSLTRLTNICTLQLSHRLFPSSYFHTSSYTKQTATPIDWSLYENNIPQPPNGVSTEQHLKEHIGGIYNEYTAEALLKSVEENVSIQDNPNLKPVLEQMSAALEMNPTYPREEKVAMMRKAAQFLKSSQ